jgi:5-methylcytosine-specific restriction endonuclease McrA
MRLRNRQMKAQDGLCFYCEQPMWLQDINGFCAKYELSRDQALSLKCTAEHLIARTDGGPDTDENIVAACHYCNQARHDGAEALAPRAFKHYVLEQLIAGKWHGFQLTKNARA